MTVCYGAHMHTLSKGADMYEQSITDVHREIARLTSLVERGAVDEQVLASYVAAAEQRVDWQPACEWESPAVLDFGGSGWVSFTCFEVATHVVTFVDSTLDGSGFEHVTLSMCAAHAHDVFTEVDSDAAMLGAKIEQLA